MLSDAVPGYFETRNISCKPRDRIRRTVECQGEARFVTTIFSGAKRKDGEYETKDVPGEWSRYRTVLKNYEADQWCRL